jgi:hypothetical protein
VEALPVAKEAKATALTGEDECVKSATTQVVVALLDSVIGHSSMAAVVSMVDGT